MKDTYPTQNVVIILPDCERMCNRFTLKWSTAYHRTKRKSPANLHRASRFAASHRLGLVPPRIVARYASNPANRLAMSAASSAVIHSKAAPGMIYQQPP